MICLCTRVAGKAKLSHGRLGQAKGLVINYGEGGATKWENRGSETFCAPPQDRVKLFAPPF